MFWPRRLPRKLRNADFLSSSPETKNERPKTRWRRCEALSASRVGEKENYRSALAGMSVKVEERGKNWFSQKTCRMERST
jgi:hypothetical protein